MRVNAQSLAFGSDANLRREKKRKVVRKEGKGANGGQKGRFTGENSDEDGCLRGKLEGVRCFLSPLQLLHRERLRGGVYTLAGVRRPFRSVGVHRQPSHWSLPIGHPAANVRRSDLFSHRAGRWVVDQGD